MVASLRDGGLWSTPFAFTFPPSPDGGFIEGGITTARLRARQTGFHHLQMVASLRAQWRVVFDDALNPGFHHLQMVASLRATSRAASLFLSSFHHLQMVASLRELQQPRSGAAADRGFHHLQMVASLRAVALGSSPANLQMFPPSPDGGFIEGCGKRRRHGGRAGRVSTISRWWLH